jgi:hypothetical protein
MPSDESSPTFQSRNILVSVAEEVQKALHSISGSVFPLKNLDTVGDTQPRHNHEADGSTAAAPEDLDYKYRASITMPLPELLGKVQTTRFGTLAVLKAINDDIAAALEVDKAAEQYAQAVEAAAAAAKSIRMKTPLFGTITGKLPALPATATFPKRNRSDQVNSSSQHSQTRNSRVEGEGGGEGVDYANGEHNHGDDEEEVSEYNNKNGRSKKLSEGSIPAGADGRDEAYNYDDDDARGYEQQQHQQQESESDASSDEDDDRNRRKS